MEKNEQKYFARNLIVVSVIAEFFSLFTLWLVESSIKYPLFIIETLSIITIYVILNNYDFRFTLNKDLAKRITSVHFLDILLIFLASILIVLEQFNITESTIRFLLAFVCASGLSGYALLNVSRITKYFSKLEILVLSFLTSFILSGFLTLILLWNDESIRSVIIPIGFIILGFASYLTHFKNKNVASSKINSLSKNIDIIPISLCIAFYAIFFYYVYPNFTLLNNSDISRHYDYSIILSRTPDLYSGFSYILFHAFGSTLNILSGSPPMTLFLSIQPVLNILLPISVYIFAKRFLANVDSRIPAIAIVFFTMLSNFSFILFTKLKAMDYYGTEINLLTSVADKSYSGVINFIQPFPWFVPLSVSFMLFIFSFLLLQFWSIPRSRFIPLFTVLIIAMYFTHITEAVIFVGILGVYSIVSKNKSLRLDDALLSSLIALIFTTIIISYMSIFWTSPLRVSGIKISSMLPIILPMSLLCICMFWRRIILHKIHLPTKSFSSKKFYYVLSVTLTVAYLFGVLTWFFNSDSSTSLIADVGVVPWFINPLMLGVVLLLALIAIRHFGNISSDNPLVFFLCLITLLFLMGRLLSFVNSNFQFTGYFEKRFLSYVFLFAVPLAPLPLIKLMDQITVKRKFFTTVSLSVIISLIVLLGFSSMILQFDYWSYVTKSPTTSQKEFQAIAYLKNILQKDSHAIIFTPSITSENILTFANPPYQLTNPEVLMYAKKPDMPLFDLSAHDLPHAYIYMHNRDFDMLKGRKENWFTDHLLLTTPVVFSNEAVTIYNATHVSYPRSNSNNHMLIPTDPNLAANSIFYAYDIISKHDSNYTVMFDRDQNALYAKTVVLSYDLPENNTLPNFFDEFTSLKNWRILSGNWDYSTDGLHGGNISKELNGIILSSVYSKNFTLDTSFRILKANPAVASYTSIIYSWMNPTNYESVAIAIVNQKSYVSFETIREGKVYSDSPWPGEIISSKWSHDSLFNITISKQGRFEDVFLNGTRYLHRDYSSESGYIGLGYSRINDVVFDHISIHNLNKLNLRESSDYLSYVRSGGNLIVLNTQGYGSIYDTLFNMGNSSHDVSKIMMISGDSLPVNISVPFISAMKNVTLLSSYVSPENKSSIFIADKIVGLGKITYVNIYPIISNFNDNKIDKITLNAIFQKISDLINLDKINANSQRDVTKVNFKEMIGSGNVTIKSNSLIFPYDQFTNVTVQNNGKETLMENVTKLDIVGYQYAILHANRISIANGNSLYGNVTMNNSLEISFKNNATLMVVSYNNKSSRFDNVSNILIQNSEPIQVYLRQPKVHVDGNSTFKQFLGEGVPGNLITSRTDLSLSGSLNLVLFMSDTYTYGTSMSYTHSNSMSAISSLQQVSKKPEYDEIRASVLSFSQFNISAVPMLVDGLLFSLFLVASVLLLFGKSRNGWVKQI